MKDITEINKCLCCDQDALRVMFDLGKQPLANSYHDGKQHQKRYPLSVNLCHSCFHVQLTHSVNPDIMFRDYPYRSGIAKTMLEYYDWFAKWSISKYPSSNVLDIACNDASQLDSFKKIGIETYGIDPAENLIAPSRAKGHEIICDYFKSGIFSRTFDLITAQNVFAHTSKPFEFLLACKEVMHDKSVLIIQTSQADTIINSQFDTIYHEHISFFNTNSMKVLVERAGLVLNNITKVPVHGKSYVFSISKGGVSDIENTLIDERAIGLYNPLIYSSFAYNSYLFAQKLRQGIELYRDCDLIGYGASAKGINLMNFVGFKPLFIIDDTPDKQNKLTPGLDIPIYPASKIDEIKDRRVLFMPLAWNFYDEIKKKIQTLRGDKSDMFLRYFPHIEVE